MRQRQRKGQATLEMAVLLAVIAAVLLIMAIYYKRAGMGRVKGAADQLGEQFSIKGATGTTTTTYNSTTTENQLANGNSTTNIENATQTQATTLNLPQTNTEALFE